MLRKALGEKACEHRYVLTVPGRGYKFVAELREAAHKIPCANTEENSLSRLTLEAKEKPGSESSIPVERLRNLPSIRKGYKFSDHFEQQDTAPLG